MSMTSRAGFRECEVLDDRGARRSMTTSTLPVAGNTLTPAPLRPARLSLSPQGPGEQRRRAGARGDIEPSWHALCLASDSVSCRSNRIPAR